VQSELQNVTTILGNHHVPVPRFLRMNPGVTHSPLYKKGIAPSFQSLFNNIYIIPYDTERSHNTVQVAPTLPAMAGKSLPRFYSRSGPLILLAS
jgi:hypothetical protein